MYGHDYSNHAYSPLALINRDNVEKSRSGLELPDRNARRPGGDTALSGWRSVPYDCLESDLRYRCP